MSSRDERWTAKPELITEISEMNNSCPYLTGHSNY